MKIYPICRLSVLCGSATLALLAVPAFAVDITDDFNDGDDTGWTRSDLIGNAIGGPWASYSFPGGTAYKISVPSQSINPALGPARAGSFRGDVVYTNRFKHAVDVLDFDSTSTPDQDVGLLALLSDLVPGTGTLDGYAFSYDTNSAAVFLVRLTNEVPSAGYGMDGGTPLVEGNDYRFVFQGFFYNGIATFRGEVYDPALPGGFDDPANPILEVYAANVNTTTDAIYNSGVGSAFCAAEFGPFPSSPAEATFDNYCSTAETDVDRDGVADSFELTLINANGGDAVEFLDDVMGSRGNPQITDFDGDGDDDRFEAITGTDATDASKTWSITKVENDGGNLKVTFPVVAGRSYSLACNSDLDSEFVVDAAAVFASGGGEGTLSVPITPGSRFCQVVVGLSAAGVCLP